MKFLFRVSVLLVLVSAANPVGLTAVAADTPGAPVLTSLSPDRGVAGTYQFTLQINGSGFGTQSVVTFDGARALTNSITSTRIEAFISRLNTSPGPVLVTVANGPQVSNALTFTITPNPPAITSFVPNSVPVGSGGFTLHIMGKYFSPGATFSFDGAPLATTFISSSQLDAQVPASMLVTPGGHDVSLVNPDGASATSGYLVDAILTAISPSFLSLDWNFHTLTVTGTGFPSVICPLRWSGSEYGSGMLDTTYVDSTTVKVSFRQQAPLERRRYTIFSCGGTSSLSLPAGLGPITSLSPAGVEAGSAGFELTVTGVNFYLSDHVYWNGVALQTSVLSSTQAKAAVPASLLTTPGTVMLSIGGAERSDEFPFLVTSSSAGSPPLITSLSTTSVDAAGPEFSFSVIGSGFVEGSTVVWAGAPLATTFQSETTLVAAAPEALTALAGSYAVTVTNPGGVTSNAKTLAVRPVLHSVDPTATVAGAPGISVTVNGAGFTSATTLVIETNGRWDLPTTLVSSSRLKATIPESALTLACVGIISGRNTSSDGEIVTSQNLPFTVRDGTKISSIAPQTAEEGSSGFTLTVNGSGYVSQSAVRWNGTALATTFVSSSQLTAAVPAALVASAGNVDITVAGPLDTTNAVAFTVTAKAPPATTSAGIVDAASYTRSAAPGGLISIFGSNLAQEEAAATGMPLPQTLKGVVVKINGTLAPLLFVSPGQINAQVPFGTPVGPATLVVESGGRASQPVQFQVTAAAPGVFTLPGGNHAIAQNHPDYSLNSSDNPVLPGGYVVLYVAGLGQTDHPVEDGAPPPFGVLCRALADVTVKIGGKDAEVLYAGLTPGFIGLAQINLKIPDVPAGEQPVEITVGGITANPTLLSIGARPQ